MMRQISVHLAVSEIDGEKVDVNVHPSKMELRFSNQEELLPSALPGAAERSSGERTDT